MAAVLLIVPDPGEAAEVVKHMASLGRISSADVSTQAMVMNETNLQDCASVFNQVAEKTGNPARAAVFDIEPESLRAIVPPPVLRVVR